MLKFTGLEYIKIAIANAYGLDKLTWNQRIKWVDEQKDLSKLISKADEPYQYISAIYAMEDALAGKPTGYVMGLDACSSGIQIMALCSGDLVAAEHCALINTGTRKDIHQTIKDNMIDNPFTRKNLKDVTMKVMYGSKAEPKKVLKDPKYISSFYTTVRQYLPECIKLLKIMLDSHSPTATEYSWALPDDHVVKVPVLKTVNYKIQLPALDNVPFVHKVKENKPVDYDVSLAANIIQSIDAYIARELLLRCNYSSAKLLNTIRIIDNFVQKEVEWDGAVSITRAYTLSARNLLSYTIGELCALRKLCNDLLDQPQFEALAVHDKFFCSPNYMNVLRKHTIDIYAELAESNIMENILKSINGKDFKYTKKQTNLGELIRKSEYIIS